MRLIDADALIENKFKNDISYNAFVSLVKRQPSAQPKLDEWCKDCKEYDHDKHRCPRFNRVIRTALDDAQPKRIRGRWIDCINSDHWKCSECGDRAPMYWDANRQEYDEWYSPFCPSCGAEMRED